TVAPIMASLRKRPYLGRSHRHRRTSSSNSSGSPPARPDQEDQADQENRGHHQMLTSSGSRELRAHTTFPPMAGVTSTPNLSDRASTIHNPLPRSDPMSLSVGGSGIFGDPSQHCKSTPSSCRVTRAQICAPGVSRMALVVSSH